MTEEKEKKEEVVAFGMTSREIAETAEALSKHKDNNHPVKSGSYEDFLKVVDKGHKALLAQKGYGKIN
jgi:adenylosuccinate lyase